MRTAPESSGQSLWAVLSRGLHGASLPLLAGTALLDVAALMAGAEGAAHLAVAPWGWHAAAIVAVTVALIPVRGHPMLGPDGSSQRHPWRLPLLWFWAVLVGYATWRVLAGVAPTGKTRTTPMGEFMVVGAWEGVLWWLAGLMLFIGVMGLLMAGFWVFLRCLVATTYAVVMVDRLVRRFVRRGSRSREQARS